jgi:2-polyprenyl-6-methoxyphenol hydroxylase-like FAD-dependent oxidoreductase
MIYDVIVAGAGPVGLFLACELRLGGASVLVLERSETSASPLKGLPFGMRGLSVPTTEALYRRGLLEEAALPQSDKPGAAPRKPGGHFAGIPIPFDKIETSGWTYRLPTPAATTIPTTLERIEPVLTKRAINSGVEIRRDAAVEDLEQTCDGVHVHADGQVITGRWLVGCDGGRSRVRKIAGFDFVGTEPEFTGYSVQVEIADPETLAMGRIYTPTGMYFQSQPGVIAMVEFDQGASHRSQPLTLEHVEAVLRRVSGAEVTLAALHLATSWTDRARQATVYRKGRVLLAGDAAHIHSPLGGQGLNLGLGDAMNLGWKLSAVVRGEMPETLLDSYTAERHPVAAKVLDWSQAQVALMRPSPASRALETIMRDLIDTRDGATFFAEQIWGVAMAYDLGGDHPLVGRSAPDFAFPDNTRLGDLLRSG